MRSVPVVLVAALLSAPAAAQPIQGTWSYRDVKRDGVYDAPRHRLGFPFAESASYTFKADGTYEYHRYQSSSTGTGNLELFWSTAGRYIVHGDRLTLTPQRTVFTSRSDIPDTPTGQATEPAGPVVTVPLLLAPHADPPTLTLPDGHGVIHVYALHTEIAG